MGAEEKYVKNLLSYVIRRLDEDVEQPQKTKDRIYVGDIMFDMEFLAHEIYEANIKREGEFLLLEFENGQTFCIRVQEIFDDSL